MARLKLVTRALPPLTWFRAFEASARHLSFTAAAAELGLTQSAISQQVRSLELRFGSPLFTRLPRGLALTDTGRRLLPGVSEAIGGLTRVTEAFQPEAEAGMLVIAVTISFAQYYITNRLSGFLAAHPKARIRLRSTLWPDDFAASMADIEIRFGLATAKDLEVTEFGQDYLVPVCAPGLLPDQADWETACQAGLIASTGTSDNWQDWADAQDLAEPNNITQTVDSYGLALELARSGAGVALVSQTLAAPMLKLGEIVFALPRRTSAKNQFFIARKPGQTGHLVLQFTEWLHDQVAEDQRIAEAIWRNKL